MAMVRETIEVKASSPISWHEANQQAIAHVSKTVKNIKSSWIKEMSVDVSDNGKSMTYHVNSRITYETKQ